MGRRHRAWYAHAGTTRLIQPTLPARPDDEEPDAMRLLAEVEHEIGDHVAAHLSHPDPRWILRWHRAELRARGVVIEEPPPPRRRSTRRRAA